MGAFINLVGKKYGKLEVMERTTNGENKRVRFRCLCECGKETIVDSANLLKGQTKSCGCNNYVPIHGLCGTPDYDIWVSMKQRCFNSKYKYFHNYGGRGITVCEHWVGSFQNFTNDMGERPSKLHSLDRIDNDGNYEPSNCRWATKIEQSRNQRVRKNSTSGIKGVVWSKEKNKWCSVIYANKKNHNLGYFHDLKKAEEVRKLAEIKYWGEESLT